MGKLNDAWDSFAERSLKGAPAIQTREMRRAYFVGAATMLQINLEVGEDGVSEADGIKILNECYAEVMEFTGAVERGEC